MAEALKGWFTEKANGSIFSSFVVISYNPKNTRNDNASYKRYSRAAAAVSVSAGGGAENTNQSLVFNIESTIFRAN